MLTLGGALPRIFSMLIAMGDSNTHKGMKVMYQYIRGSDGRYSGEVHGERIPPQLTREDFYRRAHQAQRRHEQREAIKARQRQAHDAAVGRCLAFFGVRP